MEQSRMDEFELKSSCPECGNELAPDDDGWAECYGTPECGGHQRVVVWRPCAMCGDWIDYLELCRSCAEENEPFNTGDPMHSQPVR